jgi:hypothetical protein
VQAAYERIAAENPQGLWAVVNNAGEPKDSTSVQRPLYAAPGDFGTTQPPPGLPDPAQNTSVLRQ